MGQTESRLPTSKTLLFLIAGLISEAGRAVIDFSIIPFEVQRQRRAALYHRGKEFTALQRLREKQRLLKTIQNLRQQKYITARKVGKQLEVALTRKGMTATLTSRLQRALTLTGNRYTVVVFDIPETEASARRQFRWLLKQGGFTKLQQSVWVSRADTYQLMAQFIKTAGLMSWVNLYYASNFLHAPRR